MGDPRLASVSCFMTVRAERRTDGYGSVSGIEPSDPCSGSDCVRYLHQSNGESAAAADVEALLHVGEDCCDDEVPALVEAVSLHHFGSEHC